MTVDLEALDLEPEDFDPLEPVEGAEDTSEDAEVAAIPLPAEPKFRIPKGKYKGLILPQMIGVKPSHFERVMALKQEIEADTEFQRYATSIAATYAELRREAAKKAAELSELKLRVAAAMLLMIDQMDVESVSGLRLDDGSKIDVHREPHLIVEDKEQFRQWCLRQGFERDMVLPWGKANKHLKLMLLAGEEEPPGASCYARPKVRFSDGAKK